MSTSIDNTKVHVVRRVALVALLTSVVAVGCGTPGEELGPVTGRVTFDGKPVTGAIILFQDDGRGIHMQAKLDENGRFEVSMAAGYGLPLGTYAVAVKPTGDLPPEMQGPVDPSLFTDLQRSQRPDIPQKYRRASTSGLTITVEHGGSDSIIEMISSAGA